MTRQKGEKVWVRVANGGYEHDATVVSDEGGCGLIKVMYTVCGYTDLVESSRVRGLYESSGRRRRAKAMSDRLGFGGASAPAPLSSASSALTKRRRRATGGGGRKSSTTTATRDGNIQGPPATLSSGVIANAEEEKENTKAVLESLTEGDASSRSSPLRQRPIRSGNSPGSYIASLVNQGCSGRSGEASSSIPSDRDLRADSGSRVVVRCGTSSGGDDRAAKVARPSFDAKATVVEISIASKEENEVVTDATHSDVGATTRKDSMAPKKRWLRRANEDQGIYCDIPT